MSNAITGVLARRGLDPSQYGNFQTQFDPSSPAAQPGMQAPTQPGLPDKSPMTMMGQDPQQQFAQSMQAPAAPPAQQPGVQPMQQAPQMSPQEAEIQMIEQEFAKRLQHHTDMKKKTVGAILGQIEANNPTQQPQPTA